MQCNKVIGTVERFEGHYSEICDVVLKDVNGDLTKVKFNRLCCLISTSNESITEGRCWVDDTALFLKEENHFRINYFFLIK